MPSRQIVTTVPTPDYIMGEGAWIKTVSITLEKAKTLQRLASELDKQFEPERQALYKAFADEKGVEINQLTDEQKSLAVVNSDLSERAESFFYTHYADLIDSWNWVYENGEPMPQPKEKPSIFNELTEQEFKYIQSIFNQDDKTEKN